VHEKLDVHEVVANTVDASAGTDGNRMVQEGGGELKGMNVLLVRDARYLCLALTMCHCCS